MLSSEMKCATHHRHINTQLKYASKQTLLGSEEINFGHHSAIPDRSSSPSSSMPSEEMLGERFLHPAKLLLLLHTPKNKQVDMLNGFDGLTLHLTATSVDSEYALYWSEYR